MSAIIEKKVKENSRENYAASRAIARNAGRIAEALSPEQVLKLAELQGKVETAQFELDRVKRETASAVAGLFKRF